MKLSTFCAVMAVGAAWAAAPQLDFSVPGSLRVVRGAFRDGAEGQITFGAEDERADLLRARARTRVPGGLARPARFARREAR